MNVEGLLQRKGDEVVTVRPDVTVGEVVATLAARRIGALVVSDDGTRIDGIVSERDVVAALAGARDDLLGQPVRSIMTTEVVTCELQTTVDELMAWMTDRRMRHVPVVVEGGLAGIVSIGDVVKDRIRDLETEARTLHEYISHGR